MGMFRGMGIDVTPRLKSIPFLKDVPGRAMRAAGKEARWFSIIDGLNLPPVPVRQQSAHG